MSDVIDLGQVDVATRGRLVALIDAATDEIEAAVQLLEERPAAKLREV